MSDTPNYVYVYRTSAGTVSVPAGDVELDVVWSLDARRRHKPISLKKFRGGYAINDEIRYGNTGLLLRRSRSKKPPRREILYAYETEGTIVERKKNELLNAVNSLLEQLAEYRNDLPVEYGIFMNQRDPMLHCVRPDLRTVVLPKKDIEIAKQYSWSSFYTGIRFRDDPHPYSFWSSYGMLDRIKHDPHTFIEVERNDMRSCQERLRPSNAGYMWFFHRTHDLDPLRTGLANLRDLLLSTSGETLTMMAVPSGAARGDYEKFGVTLEQCGFWPEPESRR